MSARLLATLFGVLSSGLIVSPGHAQQVTDAAKQPEGCVVYTTPSASDAWIATVTQWPLSQQIEAIRQRMTCDAGLRPYSIGVCYMAGPRVTLATPPPVDPRPEGLGLACLLDGYPLRYPVSPAFQHLITARSVKKLTFLASREASAIGGSYSIGGMVVITTKTPKETRRQWELAMREASASKAER
ncbi:hypothetical protein ACW9KT_21190 [Hymenobacter sp. HD11105]